MEELYFIDEENLVRSYVELYKAYRIHPKKKCSWGEKKSAESLANYWFNHNIDEFNNMIKKTFGEFNLGKGYFEYPTIFDESINGPREHDLCFPCVDNGNNNITIGVEAKGNETYDKLISEQVQIGQKLISEGKNTRKVDRVQSIFRSMGESDEDSKRMEEFHSLRYQLFTGLCGTIAEAKKQHSNIALFMIIQFETEISDKNALERNKRDLDRFLKYMNIYSGIKSGQIISLKVDFQKLTNYKINYSTEDIDLFIGYLHVAL